MLQQAWPLGQGNKREGLGVPTPSTSDPIFTSGPVTYLPFAPFAMVKRSIPKAGLILGTVINLLVKVPIQFPAQLGNDDPLGWFHAKTPGHVSSLL